MSRIYFHSPSGTAELRGSERAYGGNVCVGIMRTAIGEVWPSDRERWMRIVPAGHYLRELPTNTIERSIQTWMSLGDGGWIDENGERQEWFATQLNTALRWGNDAVKLLARLHGACEIHAYVEGPNRGWLADIITDGRSRNVLRENQGWEAVVELLMKRDDEPVVTSYSVTSQFPDPYLIDEKMSEEEAERLWELPREELWAQALAVLRSQGGGLEITPDGWEDFFFAPGTDASDVLRALDACSCEVR